MTPAAILPWASLDSARAGHDAQFTARTLSRLSDGATLRLARLVGDAPDAAIVGGAVVDEYSKADFP
jgi:hypothetical protein